MYTLVKNTMTSRTEVGRETMHRFTKFNDAAKFWEYFTQIEKMYPSGPRRPWVWYTIFDSHGQDVTHDPLEDETPEQYPLTSPTKE